MTNAAPPVSQHTEGLREPKDQLIALTGLTIVVKPGTQIENGTILIRNHKIEAIGADVTVPAGAETIDLKGKTAYPGLIDGFTSTAVELSEAASAQGYWNNNIKSQLKVVDGLKAEEDVNSALRSQGVVARLVAPSTGVIRGVSAVIQTGETPVEEAILNPMVMMHGRLTVDRRGGSRDSYPNSPMGAVALARQAMYDAQWYQQVWKAYQENTKLAIPERNLALEALRPVVNGRMPLMLETQNELFAFRADLFAKEFGVKLMLLGSGNEYRRLDEIAQLKCPIVVPVSFPEAPNVSTPELASVVTLESLMHWDHAPENPGRLSKAGVTIMLTSNGLKDRKSFLKQLKLAVERGLNEDKALEALTVTPAAIYGVETELGTLEAGKLASFVVTDGKLFAKKTKIVETWTGGARHEFENKPSEEIAGVWSMKIDGPADSGTKELLLELKGDEKLAAKIRPADKTDAEAVITLKSVEDVSGILTGQFESKTLGSEGTTRLSLVINRAEPAQSLGTIVWPNGDLRRVELSPSTTEFMPKKETEKKEGEEKPEAEQEKKPDDEKKPEDEKPKEDAKPDGEKADEGKKDGDKKKDDDKPSIPSSYPVNYPLGEYGVESPLKPAAVTAFTNATIWTSGPEGIIPNGTLIIDQGKVLAVGANVKIPAGAVVVDLKGKNVTAGLIDCHSHIATDGGVNESAQAITAEVRVGDFIDCDDIDIYRQLAGGVTTSNILHGSANPIGGQNQVIKFRWGLNDSQMKFAQAPQGIKCALGENVKQSNWGERFSSRYPQTRMGVEQIVADEFEAAKSYAREWAQWNQSKKGLPPRRDLELDAIVEILEKKRWIHCHSYRQDEIIAFLRVLERNGVTIGSLQHILEGYKVAEVIKAHGATASCFSDWWAYKMEVVDSIPYDGAMMHQQGIIVSFNSDDAELARRLNQEAAKAVKYGGVSPEEALKFVTLNPAKQLRIDQYVGSLEPGKHADFIVWSGDPLSNFSRVEQSWIEGTKYFDLQTDAAMRKTSGDQRQALIQKILSGGTKMRGAGEDDGDPSAYWPRHDEFCHHSHDHDDHDHGGHSH